MSIEIGEPPMTESLKFRLQEDMKAALRAQEKERLNTIRSLLAAIKQREIDDRIILDDHGISKIIEKMIKQRNDSITQYEAGHRLDLANKEKQEIELLQKYLPEALSEAQLEAFVNEAILETQGTSLKDMGKIMAVLKEKLKNQRADMRLLNEKVKEKLS